MVNEPRNQFSEKKTIFEKERDFSYFFILLFEKI